MTETRQAMSHEYAECFYQERDTGAWVTECPVCENYSEEEWNELFYADPDEFFDPPDDWDYNPW
jgi:hypothetical protein